MAYNSLNFKEILSISQKRLYLGLWKMNWYFHIEFVPIEPQRQRKYLRTFGPSTGADSEWGSGVQPNPFFLKIPFSWEIWDIFGLLCLP